MHKENMVSLYRVHFTWKQKEMQLSARSLDLTHPYFVSIKDLVFREERKLIIDPAEDDVRKAFGSSYHIMIPFQTVALIEEIREEDVQPVRAFSLVHESDAEEENTPERQTEEESDAGQDGPNGQGSGNGT